MIRSINYEGIHSVTVSEILDRFKERKVGLSVESQYDPDKVQRAAVALKDFWPSAAGSTPPSIRRSSRSRLRR